MVKTDEVWKWVVGFKGYYKVSNHGRVKSVSRTVSNGREGSRVIKEKVMSANTNRSRHPVVSLTRNGRCKVYCIHRLVLEAFVGPCPNGMQSRHLNDIRSDNRLENLCWGTPKENRQDAIKNGRSKNWGKHTNHLRGTNWHEVHKIERGENAPNAKLTEKEVKKIRKYYLAKTHTLRELSLMFQMSRKQIFNIVHKVSWNHV